MLEFIITVVGLIFYFLNWFFAALGIYVARTRYNGRLPRSPLASLSSAEVPGVTILRPLRGLDCNLYENLEASFLQDYPNFDILFSVADEGDAAISIVEELMKKYPNVRARLIIGEEIVGVNPKINNLIRPYREATSDILWILDSNVLSSPGCLSRSVSDLTNPPPRGGKQIGLVHHLPFAIYPDSALGSRMEQVFLCSTHAKMYLAINYLAIASCVAGKSCVFRKSDLELAASRKRSRGKGMLLAEGEGGLAAFGKYLGEDNMMAEAIWEELGMRHAMGHDLAGNSVGTMKFETYFRRRVRWIRVRKYMVVVSTLLEPLTECLLSGLIGSYLLYRTLSLHPLLLLPFHVVTWFSIDCYLFSLLSASSPSSSTHLRPPAHDGPSFSFLKAWLVRESLAFPIWLFAMLGDTVGWRDNGERYRVRIGGSVERVKEGQNFVERALEKVGRRWGKREYIKMSPDEENSYGAV